MQLKATTRLYLQDDHCFETEATVIAVQERYIALDQTCFYSGGGGQPPDRGVFILQGGEEIEIVSAYADENQVVWHECGSMPTINLVGKSGKLKINKERRLSLSRYHTVLHVLNTITLREYGGWITGVQIAEEYARIDFKLEHFSATMSVELEQKVNAVIQSNRKLKSFYISDADFQGRDNLLRTLDVKPPVIDGRVRVVEIEGFDAQACGGTHVEGTAKIGRFTIFRTDNKGKNNKRFYVRLDK